jgi:hypothetical protein
MSIHDASRAMPTLTRWHYVSYKTATKPEAVIDFYRKEFKPQGWQEYRMALAKVHAKEGRHLLGFAQNAMNLSFNIKAEKDGPTVVECMVNMRDRPARTPLKDLPPPATLAEGHKVIDLNRFPRLEGAGAGQGSSAQLFYDAPGDVAGALAFYRKHCAAQGWQEDDPETEIDAFPRRAFVKSGFVLDCAFGKSNKAGRVNLRIENKGNVDLRQLPRLADATDMNNERFDDVHYETDTPPPAAADFFRQELVARGWKEAASEAKSYPDGSKLLVFRHNALTLKIQLHADSVRLQSSLFGVFIPRPAAEAEALRAIDLRKFPSYKGAAGVKATSASLELTALGSVAEAVRFYRQELTKQGWQERGPAFQTAERATLRFGKDDFLLHLAVRIEGQGVAIALYNKGDVDVRKLLHPDDAKPDATSVEDDARYSTALPIEAAADFYRKQLPHFGWQEATAAEAPTEKAPARSLAFIQKSMKLVIDVTPVAEGKAALHLQTWVLGKR